MFLKPLMQLGLSLPKDPSKLNTNENYIHGNGKAGLEGTMSNDQGEIIMAFSISAKCTSNNDAEAQAALFGVKWCIQNGYSCYIIELDYLLVVNILKERRTDNYQIKRIIEETTQLMNPANVTPNHCYREAN